MQIEAAAAVTPEANADVDPAAAALAEAAASAPASTEEALRAKAEADAKADAPARPEWLPEEFETPEAMAEAFAALKGTKEEPKIEGEEPPVEEDTKTEDAPPATVDVKTISAEFEETGALSEATYENLSKLGFDKDFVDTYIEGQKARAEAVERRLNDAAGGKDNLDRMFAWASTSLTPAEIGEYNSSFANADVNAAALALEQLKGKYEAANGKDPKHLNGGKAPGTATDVFNSWAEVTKAMTDPRYSTDHAYRAKIEAKLARSNAV